MARKMLNGSGMLVRARMTCSPLTIGPDDNVRHAWLLMRQGQVHRLPVVDRDRLVGIVTRGDIERRSPARTLPDDEQEPDQLLAHVFVGGVMTFQPHTISPDTSLIDAARVMLTRRIDSLPVVDRGRLVGILTKRDVLDALVTAVSRYQSGDGLA